MARLTDRKQSPPEHTPRALRRPPYTSAVYRATVQTPGLQGSVLWVAAAPALLAALLLHCGRTESVRPPFRASVFAARALLTQQDIPGSLSIAAAGALKSSLLATPGGKKPEIRPRLHIMASV